MTADEVRMLYINRKIKGSQFKKAMIAKGHHPTVKENDSSEDSEEEKSQRKAD